VTAAPAIESYLASLGTPEPGPPRVGDGVSGAVHEYRAAVLSYLGERQAAGASGRETNELHSDLTDRLVRRLFARAEEAHLASEGDVHHPACLCAVGGYARREMSIHSDVDLLFLHRGEVSPYVRAVAERVQQWLWDAGMQVGCAVRTPRDTVKLARRDTTVTTSVLTPRFLEGDGDFFRQGVEILRRELLGDPERFVAEQAEAMRARHAAYGDSLYLLQPNLKEGAGGLRDYHVAWWTMLAAQSTARDREDFLHQGLLTESEMGELRAALDFLWRVRNQLHLLSGRKNDQMSFELQERIADAFGYGDGGPELPVERFMRDYYRHARAVESYSTLVVEQCHARVRKTPRRRKVTELGEGFRLVGGHLEIAHARVLREKPVRLLRAFAVAQAHDVPLSRTAGRMVREALPLVDDALRRDPEATATFLSLLASETRVMRTLMAMNEVGLLGAFLPEWEHIYCRWQHVMYHTYTVDVHSIFLVEELRRLWRRKYEAEFPELTELVHRVDDRAVLYLGCLLHDIGKGLGGDHSRRGAERARVCCERLGLSPERTARVVFLVRQHLLMSHLAQRRDLSDPKLILEFARVVGDRTNLRNLYLLTYADMRASSSSAWTDWKGQLLRDLFERTSEFLEAGADEPTKAMEIIERRVETRRSRAEAELLRLGVPQEEVLAYFEMMPQRYFTAHTPRQIARHAHVVLGLPRGELLATAVRPMRGGFSELIVCTPDVHGLFANVAGVLTAHHMNILGAHVYTTRTGLALEVYRVSTPPGGEPERDMAWAEMRRSLEAVLSGRLEVSELLRRRGRVVGAKAPPRRSRAHVSVSNAESDFYTIVDVTADDRLGLLYDLTSTIAEHGCAIYISKAATVLDQVADAFYVKDRDGRKLPDAPALDALREDLVRAVRRGEEHASAVGGAG